MTLSVVLHFSQAGTPYFAACSMRDAATWSSARLADAGLPDAAQRVREHFGLEPRRSLG